MMPSAPSTPLNLTGQTIKRKVGFSIDDIVGQKTSENKEKSNGQPPVHLDHKKNSSKSDNIGCPSSGQHEKRPETKRSPSSEDEIKSDLRTISKRPDLNEVNSIPGINSGFNRLHNSEQLNHNHRNHHHHQHHHLNPHQLNQLNQHQVLAAISAAAGNHSGLNPFQPNNRSYFPNLHHQADYHAYYPWLVARQQHLNMQNPFNGNSNFIDFLNFMNS